VGELITSGLLVTARQAAATLHHPVGCRRVGGI